MSEQNTPDHGQGVSPESFRNAAGWIEHGLPLIPDSRSRRKRRLESTVRGLRQIADELERGRQRLSDPTLEAVHDARRQLSEAVGREATQEAFSRLLRANDARKQELVNRRMARYARERVE